MKGITVQRTVHPEPVTLTCGHDVPLTHTKGDRVRVCHVCGTHNVVHVDVTYTFHYRVHEVKPLPGMR